MRSMNAITKVGGILFWCAVAWLIVAGVLALQFWPAVPNTAAGWVAFIAFGPPLYVLGEGVFEWLWSTRAGRAVSEHPSSSLRILVGVILGAAVLVIGLLVSSYFGVQ